jgi:dihydroorotate dehydrogenase (fumarate)
VLIRNVEINPGVMNAACNIAKTPDDVEAFAKTKTGAIVVGSITPRERPGNPAPQWFDGGEFAINSFGMPNGGRLYYDEHLPTMIDLAHQANKAFILSTAGFSAADYGELAALAQRHGVDVLELNLGCPNILVDGEQKPIASFDRDYMQKIIEAARSETDLPITVKLSPYSNPEDLKETAKLLIALDYVDGVVTSNTFPNSFTLDETLEPVITSAVKNVGGMSGRGLQPIALGQVKAFRELLPPHIAVIGAGGIETLEDVERYMAAGADGVQAATLIVREGHAAIDQLVA